jgi:hypothetical protein
MKVEKVNNKCFSSDFENDHSHMKRLRLDKA